MTVIPAQRIPVQRTSRAATTNSPASLTQSGARRSAGCPACASPRITTLAMTLTDGTPVEFTSCHECEHRTWTHQGEALPFTDVIARTTKQKV